MSHIPAMANIKEKVTAEHRRVFYIEPSIYNKLADRLHRDGVKVTEWIRDQVNAFLATPEEKTTANVPILMPGPSTTNCLPIMEFRVRKGSYINLEITGKQTYGVRIGNKTFLDAGPTEEYVVMLRQETGQLELAPKA